MNTFSVKPAIQLEVAVSNAPGSLAEIAEALAKAGANIEGISTTTSSAQAGTAGMDHFVVDKVDVAKKALQSLGKECSEQKMIAFQSPNQPGVIATVTKALGDAGINIEEMYHGVTGGVCASLFFVGVSPSDFDKAMDIAKGL